MSNAQEFAAFSRLYDFLPIGVFRSHPDGSWLGVNIALARLNGYDTAADYVASVRDIASECYVRPADREEFRRRLEVDGECAGFEVEIYRHRTREKIWARVSARAHRSAEGALLHYEGTVEDITEAVHARQALEEREAALREVANHVPGMMYRLRTQGLELQRFDFVSERSHEVTGLSPQALYDNPRAGWMLRHPDDAERVAAEIRRTNLSGERLDVEYRQRMPDGSVKWVHQTSSVAQPDGDGAIRFGYVQDVTARKLAEAASQRAAAELEQIVALLPGAVFRYVRRRRDGVAHYSYVSAGVQPLLGMSSAEAMADVLSMVQRIHPEDRERFETESDLAIAARERFSTVMRMLAPHPEGGTALKWVHNFSAPAPGTDDEEVRVGVLLDVTALREAELAQQRSAVQLQQMIDLLPGVMFRTELPADGSRGWARYTYVSAAAKPLFGITPEEALRDPRVMVDLTHPDDIAQAADSVLDALAERLPLSVEFRMRTRSGQERWVHLVSQPALDPLDGREGRVGMLFDISARKVAEQALRDNSTLWRRALESTGDGAWDWHLDSGEIVLSDSLKALYGHAPDAAMEGPRSLEALIHPDDLAGMRAAVEAHLRGDTPVFMHERRMRHADGRWLHILSRGMVLARDDAGRPLRMIGTHTDITARRQAEALRLERDAAAAADRAKTEFLSTVSHELRTPLNAVLGFAQLLEHTGMSSARQLGWLQQIIASGRHLLALMDDILDLSSVQSGRLRLELEDVALHPLLRQAWTMLEPSARAQQVQLFDELALHEAVAGQAGAAAAVGLPAGSGWPVRADRRRLLQVLSNLLSNAIKYNRLGGSVRCSAQAESGPAGMRWLALEVADTGSGMTSDQLARLFRPFERLGAQRGNVPGTGLGLAVSRSLVEAMGGTLGVRSELGLGSCFTLRLPLAAASAAPTSPTPSA